jgi:DNA repair photolyase
MMARRFGRTGDFSWKDMALRKEVLTKDFARRVGRIMFPSTHDIFDFSPFKEACFAVLEKLLESGNEVLVTTKPRLSVIKEITRQFTRYRNQIQFRFTITSNDDELLRFWEPNAPRFRERLAALAYAFRETFKTSVSIEPFLDYDPRELVETVEPFTTDSIWIGRMNYIRRKNLTRMDRPFYDSIRKNYGTHHLQEVVAKLEAYPKIRIKDSIRTQLLQGLTT